jgi:hypothetical protein
LPTLLGFLSRLFVENGKRFVSGILHNFGVFVLMPTRMIS